jgi:hypothetical protein
MGSMTGKHVKFMERTVVEEIVDAFTSEHLPFFVLTGYGPFRTSTNGRLATFFKIF